MSSIHWFAIRVKSNREKVTAESLANRGYEVFLPEYKRASAKGPTVLFPGYIFSRFDANNRLPVLILPGVVHIVGIGKTPAPVDADEVESLRLVIRTGLPLNPEVPYRVGDKVRIAQGPLTGATGIVEGHKCERLIVSISLLQRSVSVVLEPEWVGRSTAAAVGPS